MKEVYQPCAYGKPEVAACAKDGAGNEFAYYQYHYAGRNYFGKNADAIHPVGRNIFFVDQLVAVRLQYLTYHEAEENETDVEAY